MEENGQIYIILDDKEPDIDEIEAYKEALNKEEALRQDYFSDGIKDYIDEKMKKYNKIIENRQNNEKN